MILGSKIDSVRILTIRRSILTTDILPPDLQHHSFKIMLDGNLNLAPITNPQRVLDLATGTGIWAIEFGSSSPLTPPPILTPSSTRTPLRVCNRHRSQSHPARLVTFPLSLPSPFAT